MTWSYVTAIVAACRVCHKDAEEKEAEREMIKEKEKEIRNDKAREKRRGKEKEREKEGEKEKEKENEKEMPEDELFSPPTRILERIQLDIVDFQVFATSKNFPRYCLIVFDHYSNFVVLRPFVKLKPLHIWEAFVHFGQHWGVPDKIHVENSPEYSMYPYNSDR